MLQAIINTSKIVWSVCNLKTLVQIHIELPESTLKMIHFWIFEGAIQKSFQHLLKDYDVILMRCTNLRRPHIVYNGVSTLQMVTYFYYKQAVLKWVLVDQRVPAQVMSLVLRPLRVLGSTPWEEYKKLLIHIVDSMAQWLGTLLLLRVTTVIAKLMVNSNPSLIVASLDNVLPDNYLYLVESNKQQIKEIRSRSQLENNGNS